MDDDADRNEAGEYDSREDGGGASVVDEVRLLVEEGMTYAQAEIAYQRARMSYAGKQAKQIAILTGLAAAMVLFALFAVVFGAILILTPLVTAAGATAIVVGVLLVVAAVLGLSAKSKAKEIRDVFKAEDE